MTPMTVWVLIPVFNRLAHTKVILEGLRQQKGVTLQVVVVDDGSTDGTSAFLAQQRDVITLQGNGQLWWAGAIDLALKFIHPKLATGDFFLFVNNDTCFDDGYVAALVSASQTNGRAVVGCMLRSSVPPYEFLDMGVRANLWAMATWHITRDLDPEEVQQPRGTYPVDFLPGRGTLYPAEVLGRIGAMRPRLLPHYHADYEYADRARRAGFPLLVTSSAVAYSTDDFGNQRRMPTLWQRKFGKGSAENILHKVAFFMLVGSASQRWTAIPRMLWAAVKRVLYRLLKILSLLSRRFPHLHMLLKTRSSTVARARLLASIERRWARRMEALQVYCAALFGELRRGHIALIGQATARNRPFFERLGVYADHMPNEGEADLVFCAFDCLTEAVATLSTVPQPRLQGVLYCVVYGQTDNGVDAVLQNLGRRPYFELLLDATIGGVDAVPFLDGARDVLGNSHARVLAVRKVM